MWPFKGQPAKNEEKKELTLVLHSSFVVPYTPADTDEEIWSFIQRHLKNPEFVEIEPKDIKRSCKTGEIIELNVSATLQIREEPDNDRRI